jgi:hypothetical protein
MPQAVDRSQRNEPKSGNFHRLASRRRNANGAS